MQVLSKHIRHSSSPVLDEKTKEALTFLYNKLETGLVVPILLGLDVLVNSDSDVRSYVSEFNDRQSVADSNHSIYEFDLIAVLIGLKVFWSLLRYKQL